MSVATNGNSSSVSALIHNQDVERIRALLGPLPAPRAWPALVVLIGVPGSGKTTLRRAIAERMPVVSLSADEIRHALFATPDYSFGESQRLSRAVRTLIGELLDQRLTVVYDDSNLTEWERQPLYTLAAAHRVRLVLIHVTAPMRVIMERLQGHAEAAADDTDDLNSHDRRMAGRYEPITRPHLTVDTSRDVRQFVEGVVLDLEEG
jgi:predicted kinase